MTRQMLRLIGEPFTLDIGKAQRELGYRPVMSREQGLKAMQGSKAPNEASNKGDLVPDEQLV
jgi:hypothetical protein